LTIARNYHVRSNEVDSSPNEVESGHINNTVNNNIQNSNQTNRMPSLKENNESNNNVKNKDYDKYNDNILKLINKTKNFDLLNHETTQKMLDEKYKYLPSFIYHSKLTLLLVFLIFYSINISIYYIGDTNSADLTFKSKIICYIILSIFIIIENFQFINSVKEKSFLTYITSFKNIIELINFPLCILTLSLEDSDSKSSLFSSTILMSYCIFILNLNKFFGIGPYVNVFGKIIIRAYKLFLILLIILVGFVLSFKNRSNYYLQLKNNNQTFDKNNEITAFEGDFASNFYSSIIMTVGQIASSGMGINELNSESLINFIIYGIFIFIMPILFINIFTGIAIDEIRKLLDNSKVEIISTKIEFVYKIEPFRENKYFKKLESLLQKIDRFIGKLKKEIKKFNYLTVAIENYRNAKLEKEEKEEIGEIKEMLIEQEDKNSKLLNELKKNSSLMQSQFNLINKKIMNKREEKIVVLNKTENKNEQAAGTSKDQLENFEGNKDTILNEIKLMQIKIETIDKKLEKIEKRGTIPTNKDNSVNSEDKIQLMLNDFQKKMIDTFDKKIEKIEKRDEKHRKKETKTEIQTENKDLTQVESKYLNIHKT
jgi:hypothetical protein